MQRISYAKDLINNNRDKLASHPKSFDSTENYLANAVTAIHKYLQGISSELHLTNTHDSPSCNITISIKDQYQTLRLEMSTNDTNRIIIDNMTKGTPSCRLPR